MAWVFGDFFTARRRERQGKNDKGVFRFLNFGALGGSKFYTFLNAKTTSGAGLGFLELVGDAADTVFDEWDVEVDEKTEGFPGQLQISGELGLVDGREFDDSF